MWPWIENTRGWQCPNCGSAHAPSVLTCPTAIKTSRMDSRHDHLNTHAFPYKVPSDTPAQTLNICGCDGTPHTHRD